MTYITFYPYPPEYDGPLTDDEPECDCDPDDCGCDEPDYENMIAEREIDRAADWGY